jgi:hypothetical protein
MQGRVSRLTKLPGAARHNLQSLLLAPNIYYARRFEASLAQASVACFLPIIPALSGQLPARACSRIMA